MHPLPLLIGILRTFIESNHQEFIGIRKFIKGGIFIQQFKFQFLTGTSLRLRYKYIVFFFS